MLMEIPFGESQSLGNREGRNFRGAFPQGMSQKTCEMVSPPRRDLRCGPLSQKNGCGAVFAPQPICFQEVWL